MGISDRWFRRRPSDDELREELEAHVAMRAEHDGVDDAAAKRRLGNVLRTREEMRRVWIADWWDALREDAWFTWRSWRRQPGFALGAILVLALGLGASTALFAALDRVPGVADAAIDLRVFVVAAGLVAVTGTAVGMWPAISVFRVGALHGLRSTATSLPGARPRVRFALVTTQVALTLALLGGSALLLRSLWNVMAVPLGFDAERVITLTAVLSPVRYPTTERGAVFLEELLARARAMPGTVSAALSNVAPPPLLSGVMVSGIEVEGRAVESNAPRPPIRLRSVTPRYFETFRIPVVRGRTFQEADVAGQPAVALNETAERVLFGGQPAIGRRIRFPVRPSIPGLPVLRDWYTVVGVTVDVRNGQALTDAPNPEMYFATRPGRWVNPLPVGPWAYSRCGPRHLLSTRRPSSGRLPPTSIRDRS